MLLSVARRKIKDEKKIKDGFGYSKEFPGGLPLTRPFFSIVSSGTCGFDTFAVR